MVIVDSIIWIKCQILALFAPNPTRADSTRVILFESSNRSRGRPIRRVHNKSIRRRKIKTNRRAWPGGIRKSKVSRFIQDSKETWIFQKRKSFNMSDSCLMALKACLIGCLLPLLDHHTPINTRANIRCQTKKEKKKKGGFGDTLPTNPPKAINIFISNPSQSSHSANISTPRATDHTSLIGKGLQNQNCTFMTFKYTLHMYSCYYWLCCM